MVQVTICRADALICAPLAEVEDLKLNSAVKTSPWCFTFAKEGMAT